MGKFEEKAALWMGLQAAKAIIEEQENNYLQPVAIKALDAALEMVESESYSMKKRASRQREMKDATFLNALLRKKGITQQEIANHFGIAQQSVAIWQQRKRIPRCKFGEVCDFISATEDEKLELLKIQNGVI